MKRTLRGLVAALGIGLLSSAIVIAPGIGLGESTRALALCVTSVSPTCTPANSAWLAEVGILGVTNAPTTPADQGIGGASGKQPTKPGGGRLGMIFDVVQSAGALFGWDITQLFGDPDTGGNLTGRGVLSENGLNNQTITAPAEYPGDTRQPQSLRVSKSDVLPDGRYRPVRFGPNAPNTCTMETCTHAEMQPPTIGSNTTTVQATLDFWHRMPVSNTEHGYPGQSSNTTNGVRALCRDMTSGNLTFYEAQRNPPTAYYSLGNPNTRNLTGSRTPITCPTGTTLWVMARGAETLWNAVSNRPMYYEGGYQMGSDMLWFHPSHPLRATSNDGRVNRTLRCADAGGVVTAFTDSTLMALGSTTALPDLTCPTGSRAVDTESFWSPSTGGTPVPIIPPDTLKAPSTIPAEVIRPDCDEGGCVVTLTRDDVSCGPVADECLDWAEDWKVNPQRYKCAYGGQPVSINVCSMYRQPKLGILPNVDAETGAFHEPSHPAPQGWRNPSTSTGTGTTPGTGTNPGRDCQDEGAAEASNPLGWLAVQVRCALVAAFVPSQTVVNSATTALGTAWNNTGLGKVATALTAWSFVPPGQGCGGLTIPWSQIYPTGQNVQILNACPGSPLAPTAALSFWVVGIFAVLGSIYSITRSIGGIVGYTGLGDGSAS